MLWVSKRVLFNTELLILHSEGFCFCSRPAEGFVCCRADLVMLAVISWVNPRLRYIPRVSQSLGCFIQELVGKT